MTPATTATTTQAANKPKLTTGYLPPDATAPAPMAMPVKTMVMNNGSLMVFICSRMVVNLNGEPGNFSEPGFLLATGLRLE